MLTRRTGTRTTVASAVAVAVIIPFHLTTAAFAAVGDELLDSTATWQYWDRGTDPAADAATTLAWTNPDSAYDDRAWPTGTGSFGVEPSTTITTPWMRGYDSGGNIPTYFMRTEVNLTADDLAGATGFDATFAYDDGAIIYVNGVEAYRTSTMAGVDVSTGNLQWSAAQSSDMMQETVRLDADLFTEGVNTIAVSVHDRSATSSDVYFQWRSLVATDAEPVLPPVITDISLHAGADETRANLAWFSESTSTEMVQVTRASAMTGDGFPADARTIPTTESGDSYDGKRYHHATLTDLAPSTDYVYRVGSDEGGWSEPITFSTEAFDEDGSTVLWVGDPQIGSSGNVESDAAGWEVAVNTMTNLYPDADLILSTGDQVETAGNATEYDAFLAPEELAEVPFAYNVGNHDTNSVAYDQHFNQPNSSTDGSATGRDYWYTYENVLYVGLDSNRTSAADIQAHADFVEQSIAAAGEVDWTIVTFHHSVYSQANHLDDSNVIRLRNQLTDDLSRLGVDLVLSGHDHIHTRSHLMRGNTPVVPETPAAPGDVLTPAEGEVLYMTGNSSSGSKFYAYYSPDGSGRVQPYTAYWNQDYTPDFTHIDVTTSALTLTTYDVNGLDIVDKVTLEKGDTVAPELTVPGDVNLEVGDEFDALEGVSANDAVDGDLTGSVEVVGTVDTTTAGTYTLEYRVTDAAGNTATATRVVTVVDAAADVDVTVSATTRALAGRQYVSVVATNNESVPVDMTIETAYGSKTFADVRPGTSASVSFNSRLTSIPAGEVTVSVAGVVGGESVTAIKTAAYPAS